MRCPLLAAIVLAGCATSAPRSSVPRLSSIPDAPALESILAREVDPLASEDARALLEAPIDADAAVRVAVLNNRDLRAELREVGVVRGEIVQAGLLPNPIAEVEFLPERDTKVELRVEYEITGLLMAPRRRRALSPELERARHRTAGAVVQLGYVVRAAFYRAQASRERLALAQRTLDALIAARDAARAMFESGGARELDLATREASYERGRVEVAELELEHASDRERLARLLGVHGPDVSFELEGDLPPAPEALALDEDVEGSALAANLELLAARQRIESLSRRAGVERLEGAMPSIAVDVHGLVGNPREEVDNREFRLSAGVSVGVPIFDRRQGTVAALVAELGGTLERFYGLAVAIRSAARDARNHLVSAHRRARHLDEVIVPAQARVTRHTMLQYNAMQIGIYELLAAHREELEARHAQIETRREFWTARAVMDALLAGARVAGGD